MVNPGIFALSAVVLFAAFAAIAAVYGGEQTRYYVALALFVGAISQFAAQDVSPLARPLSIGLSYAAVVLGVVAIVVWK